MVRLSRKGLPQKAMYFRENEKVCPLGLWSVRICGGDVQKTGNSEGGEEQRGFFGVRGNFF